MVLTSAEDLDSPQMSDWVTSMSASQPWPDEMEAAEGVGGAGITEVSSFDKGRADSQVSYCESLPA